MELDLEFVIYGLIIILALIPLYIYRKAIYKKFYKTGNIKNFLRDIDAYLSVHHPKIKFDYSHILKKVELEEKDIRIKETLIVEELVRQYANQDYELSTQKSIDKDKLWSSYDQNSKLLKDNKFPIDWNQRKEAAWMRDENRCNRCGIKMKLLDSHALLAKQMRNGGGFNLENIVILCNDCTRVIKSANLERTAKDLNILDNLMRRVSN
ncbi:MAG: hypothetical protein C0625_12810 [Arcobacter sp.]|nr:MAG: hypothetical protein C0625_12810 [Arcobacter sp.]